MSPVQLMRPKGSHDEMQIHLAVMSGGAIQQAHEVLDQLARERFYGSVTFPFKNGDVSLIRREETILPCDGESNATKGRTESGHERTR